MVAAGGTARLPLGATAALRATRTKRRAPERAGKEPFGSWGFRDSGKLELGHTDSVRARRITTRNAHKNTNKWLHCTRAYHATRRRSDARVVGLRLCSHPHTVHHGLVPTLLFARRGLFRPGRYLLVPYDPDLTSPMASPRSVRAHARTPAARPSTRVQTPSCHTFT